MQRTAIKLSVFKFMASIVDYRSKLDKV